eukprot:scaffold13857_cov20-Tisochrysis_lutea.AAC.1
MRPLSRHTPDKLLDLYLHAALLPLWLAFPCLVRDRLSTYDFRSQPHAGPFIKNAYPSSETQVVHAAGRTDMQLLPVGDCVITRVVWLGRLAGQHGAHALARHDQRHRLHLLAAIRHPGVWFWEGGSYVDARKQMNGQLRQINHDDDLGKQHWRHILIAVSNPDWWLWEGGCCAGCYVDWKRLKTSTEVMQLS